MKLYSTPIDGTYDYKSPNFKGTYNLQQVNVAVLGESEKQYIIKLKLPVGNHRQNDLKKVRKHNVRLRGMIARVTNKKKPLYDHSAAWWNN